MTVKYVFDNNTNNEWLPGEGIPELLKDMKNPVGIEIGSDHGWTTEYLLKSVPDLFVHTIDPYSSYIDWDGTPSSEFAREQAHRNLIEATKDFPDRTKHHLLTSDDAAKEFEDESMDFIFVDGIHTYEQVHKDCANYWPKVKKGGLLCGHDYNAVEGVKRAVDEVAEKLGKKISFTKQDIWYWYKD